MMEEQADKIMNHPQAMTAEEQYGRSAMGMAGTGTFGDRGPELPPAPQMSNQMVPNSGGQLQGNPFEQEQYNNVNLPDQPIAYGGGMAEQLLNDNEVPKELKKKYWYVFHKDNVLTFLDEKRKASKLLDFDITRIDLLNSMDYYEYDFDTELELNVIRSRFATKLDRALGFKGQNIKNERIVLQSQFSENRQISSMGTDNPIQQGFFKRLLGRR